MVDNSITDNELDVLVSKCLGYGVGVFSSVNYGDSTLRMLDIMGANGYEWNIHQENQTYAVWFCRREWITNNLAQSRALPYGKSDSLWRAVVFAVLNVFRV